MSVEGLTFRWHDEGTIAGQLVTSAASEPTPGFPLSQSLGWQSAKVAVDAIVTLYTASTSPLSAFDYFACYAGDLPTVEPLDGDGTTPSLAGELELTCNNGDSAEQIWIEPLRAGLPYRRFSNAGRYSISAGGNGFAGTADVVDQIRFKNTTSEEITVRWLVAAA